MSVKSIVLPKKKEIHQEKPISYTLQQKINAANNALETAEKKVRAAYDYATKVEGYRPEEARKLLYAKLKYTEQWIRKFLPDEAKDISKRRLDQSHRRKISESLKERNREELLELRDFGIKKSQVTIGEDKESGKKLRQEVLSMPVPKVEDYLPKSNKQHMLGIVIPKDRVKRFYDDVLKIRDKAEKEGLIINLDGTVMVQP